MNTYIRLHDGYLNMDYSFWEEENQYEADGFTFDGNYYDLREFRWVFDDPLIDQVHKTLPLAIKWVDEENIVLFEQVEVVEKGASSKVLPYL